MPFTREEFLDVFAAYNTAWWPVALVLWLVTAGAVLAAGRSKEPPHVVVSLLLAVHWAWSAVTYHAVFFSRINPAAWLFAVGFLVEAILLVWWGVVRRQLRFTAKRSGQRMLAGILAMYALVYPLISIADGLKYPRVPTFGVPCPTTIFTVACFLVAEAAPRQVLLIPLLWAVVGTTAAFLLGVHADLALAVAAALLAGLYATAPRGRLADGPTQGSGLPR